MSVGCVAESIQAGYKQTEVGMIPEDWDLFALGNIIEYVKGFAFSAHDYQLHGIRIIRVSDTTYDGIKEDESVYIDEKKAKGFKKWSLREGDLIISTVGSKPPMYDSLVGKATIVRAKDVGALLNQNAVIIRSRKWSLGGQYLLHNHLKQKRYLSHIEKIFRGNANQASITLKELFEYPIPLPPTLSEQEAISTVLSDTDALIESLEQLIAKKRQIKQGAMQKLLTGKRRLPGFSGEWEMKLLDEVIASCSSGATPYRGRPDYYKGKVKWITSGELNYNLITDTLEHISEEAVEHTNLKIHPIGTFLMAITGLEAAGTRGACGIVGSPATTNQSCMAVYPTSELKTEYLYHYYVFRGNELALQYCQGTKQQSYTAKLVKLLPINLPPTLEEQNAIATILSDMDAGIALLEEKLKKSRMFKQGMMQELLTGRIRLV